MTNEPARSGLIHRAEKAGQFFETAFLVTLLSSMILLATVQIILRNFFDSGFAWADEALRIMVLWLTMVGAVVASRLDRHISIDVMSRLLPARVMAWFAMLVNLFTATVAALLAWYSWSFVADSRAFGDLIIGGLPAWAFQAIMPVGFFLIAYRYLILAIQRLREGLGGAAAP